MLIQSITELIGNTPSIEIPETIHKIKGFRLFAKLELFNPFGSIKDRVAWALVKEEIETIIKNRQTLIEVSSGNTAKALAGIAGLLGVPFKTVTNRAKVMEVKQILQILGAKIEELPGLSECPDPSDPNNPLLFVEREVATNQNNYFHTKQYTSSRNISIHFDTTGAEIINDIGHIDYFFAGLGTAGSSRGVAERLREQNKNLKVYGVVSSSGDFLPGIRSRDEMHEVGIFDRSVYDSIIEVDTKESLDCMILLIRKLGIFSGPSGGGALAAAVKYLNSIDGTTLHGKRGVFIVCDRFEWYLSYIRKRMPELFGTQKPTGVRTLSEAEINSAKQLTVSEAMELLKHDPPLIIDLRANFAFNSGHIPGAINILDAHLEEMLETGLPFSKDRRVLVVCRVGDLSKIFAAYFQTKGVVSHSLEGGMNNWRSARAPICRVALD